MGLLYIRCDYIDIYSRSHASGRMANHFKECLCHNNGVVNKSTIYWLQTSQNTVLANPPKRQLKYYISILYHVQKEKAISIVNEVGGNYEKVLILSTFRSASADVCARFFAKDMHSGKRAEIEKDIKAQMSVLLEGRGFVIESVLLKSIPLPSGLYSAIDAKLRAEPQAQQMEFVLQRERKEADRNRIEAEGIRDAQKIIKEGITEANIEWRS